MEDDTNMIWRALADPTRRRLIELLSGRPRTVGELCAPFAGELTRFAVMKHLGVLRDAGLVLTRKEGRRSWNHLNAVPLRRLYERWVGPRADAIATSLTALKRHAERDEAQPETSAMPASSTIPVHVIEQALRIAAPRERVFRALTEETSQWFWRGANRDNPPSVIEPRIGGRFFHDLGGGTGKLFATITLLEPPRRMRMAGDFGHGEAVLCNITFDLVDTASGCEVRVSHHVAGEVMEEMIKEFDDGWAYELNSLRSYIEESAA